MSHVKHSNLKIWPDNYVVMMIDLRKEGMGFKRIADQLTVNGFAVSKKTVTNKYYCMFPDEIGKLANRAPKYNANKMNLKTYPQEDIDFIISKRAEMKSYREIGILFKAKGKSYGRNTIADIYLKFCPDVEKVEVIAPRSNWTEEEFEFVRHHKQDLGLSFSQIALKMGNRSRTSIISRYYERYPVEKGRVRVAATLRLSVIMREREKNNLLIGANKAGQKFPHADCTLLEPWQCRAILDEDPMNPTWCPNRKSELVKSRVLS